MNINTLAAAILIASVPAITNAQSIKTGDWAGYHGGIYTTVTNWADSTHDNLDTGNTTGDFDLNGRTTGLLLGADWQQDNIVYGVEFDAGWGSIDGKTDVICSLGGCETDITAIYSLRGRLGYSYGQFLPYVTAGAVMATIEADVNDGLGHDDENVYGYTLGIGTDFAVNDQFSLGAELLYMDFNSFEMPVTTYPGSPDTVTDEIETNLTTLRISAKFHF